MSVLLGEWGFLDNPNDTSGNNHTASVNFTPAYTTGPQTDTRAIILNNSTYTINYGRTGLEPTSASGGLVTMAWVKTNSYISAYSCIISKVRAYDSSRSNLSIYDEGLFRMARWKSRLSYANVNDVFLDNAWHHVCIVDADDRYAVLIDGTAVTDVTDDQSANSLNSWENYPWISGYNENLSGMSSDTNFYLSGVRIFSGTLTNTEVNTWMNTPIVASASRSGKAKVWSGSAFVQHPVKRYTGTDWVAASLVGYDGSEWVVAK